MASDQGTSRLGRPRRAATDAAIVRAAVELMAEGGVDATSLASVARRAGVARATVYLRWPSRSALIGAAARAAVGGNVLPLTGDIAEDVRVAATFIQRVFDQPASPAILPEIMRGVLATPPELSFEAVAPRRREFARLYLAGAVEQGFDPTIDPHLPFDVLLGTSLAHLMAHRRPMTVDEAAQLASVVIRGFSTSAS